jgi:hypothetical protein
MRQDSLGRRPQDLSAYLVRHSTGQVRERHTDMQAEVACSMRYAQIVKDVHMKYSYIILM